jgi:peptidyl-prolyl cis-trans isomerase SurA
MKKLTTFLILFNILLLNTGFAQKQEVLLTIDDHEITAEEFLRIYNKNQQNPQSGEKTSIEDYLELFINFKLKVIEAERLNLDTLPSIKKELKKYKNELAKPYLRDDEVMEKMIREAYERSKKEVKASHVMIQIPKPAAYKDTLHAYQKALKIRRRIVRRNENFSEVARATSDDPSVKSNGGNLGYFTALQMVYPFENKAYTMDINDISRPVRTPHGYHIIKKTGERKATGKVKVAHIMLLAPQSMPKEKREKKKEQINDIYHRIKSGEKFEELAKKYSEDKASAQKGGELPWFGVGRMVPEFEKAAFSLEKKGEISQPVKTSIGWHIIKLLDKKTLGTYEEEKRKLKRQVMKSPRSDIARDSLTARLKREYEFVEHPGNFHNLYRFIKEENTKIDREQLMNYNRNNKLFTINNRSFGTNDFINYLLSPPDDKYEKRYEGQYLLDKTYARFQEEKIIDYEKERLPEKYSEYKYIMKEYHDGILLFEIMDRKVWTKASKDSTGLRRYYNNHKNNYMWPERFKGKIYLCDNQEILKKVKKMKKGGLFRKKYSDEELLKEINQNGEKLEIKKGTFTKGENKIIDQYAWDIGNKKSLKDKHPYYVKGEIIPPQVKKLEEARGSVLADYQNHLEKQWIKKLKKRYTIEVNERVLNEIKKN